MSTDLGLAIQAQQSYQKTQQTMSIKATHQSPVSEASGVQKAFKTEFNKFAQMSPSAILSQIKSNISTASSPIEPNALSAVIKDAKTAMTKHENLVRKSLIGEASTIEILTSTNEVTNVLKTLATVRDKMMEAYEKIWNMPV